MDSDSIKNFRDKYIQIIDDNMTLEISALQELIAINSVRTEPVTTAEGQFYPFGRGVQEAFLCSLKQGEDMGFETENVDNYGGHIDFGQGDETIGIVGHLDVVPLGDGWTKDPLGGEIEDGFMYGRGTSDDKGPLVAALFALKALKDAGFQPEKRIRVILGLDEESGWDGMEYYLQKVKAPDYGFTPDADFPVLNGEKGMMGFDIAKKISQKQVQGLQLSSLKGGTAPNMVAQSARAVVHGKDTADYDRIKALAAAYCDETGRTVKAKGVGTSLEITAEGVSAHGAAPEAGINAISIIMDFMGRLNFGNDEVNDFVQFYNSHIGFAVNGEKIGCGFSDRESGKLTWNVGLVNYDKESISVNVNVRFPVTCQSDQIYQGIEPTMNKYNLGVVKGEEMKPIYFPPDSPMVKTFMEVYQQNTGDMESKPIVIGGSTYAKAMDNIAAFGGLFPGEEDRMHQADERISLESLRTMTKIYADAIFKMAQPDFKFN